VNLFLRRFLALTAITWIAAAGLMATAAFAVDDSETMAARKDSENVPIEITADQLISNNQEKYAEFLGNVNASQGTFSISADKLRIYYEGDLINPENKSTGNELLKKIVASGHVRITSEQYTAETDQAEYDTQSMTIVLSGKNSTVTSGKNSISGSKIILYRKDGRVRVEGSESKRIKAIFYSTEKTSGPFQTEKPEK